MRKTILFGILVLLPAAIVSGASLASCSTVKCGTGTHEEAGKCVASLPNECGPGTVSQGGKCVAVPDPCGPNTTWDGDGGVCFGTGGGGGDGGTGPMHGARWTGIHMTKPESIATLVNIQLPGYFADGTIVVILRTEPSVAGFVNLHGGDGVKVSDDPLTYTFRDGFIPPTVAASLGTPYTGTDGLQYTPFSTTDHFDMLFAVIVQSSNPQPPLYLYNASISGNLNPDQIPTSNDPPLSGVIKGCFTPTTLSPGKYGAADIYVDVLSQTIEQLIESSGGAVDADCTGSGSNNGYLFEATWEADELVELTTATAQDGGVSDAATTD